MFISLQPTALLLCRRSDPVARFHCRGFVNAYGLLRMSFVSITSESNPRKCELSPRCARASTRYPGAVLNNTKTKRLFDQIRSETRLSTLVQMTPPTNGYSPFDFQTTPVVGTSRFPNRFRQHKFLSVFMRTTSNRPGRGTVKQVFSLFYTPSKHIANRLKTGTNRHDWRDRHNQDRMNRLIEIVVQTTNVDLQVCMYVTDTRLGCTPNLCSITRKHVRAMFLLSAGARVKVPLHDDFR